MKIIKLFQASFQESLRLRKDKISGNYAKRAVNETFKVERKRGKKVSIAIYTLYYFLFVLGLNFLITLITNVIYNTDPEKLTLKMTVNFLPYSVFWSLALIWLFIVVIGKRYSQRFIYPYRFHFHIAVTYLFWTILETNLFFMTGFYGTLGILGTLVFWGSVAMASYLIIRSRVSSLLELMYGPMVKRTVTDRTINKLFRFLMTYGWGLVGVGIIIRTAFSGTGSLKADWFGILTAILMWFAINIGTVAFKSYLIFPYMLQGYYKLKYPEEYREWEEQTPEEWYGEKYLKKHGGHFKNDKQ